MSNTLLTIGVDGGATKVSAWQVRFKSEDSSFFLGKSNCETRYSNIPGFIPDFKPVDIGRQLKEFQQDDVQPTDAETQQASCYIEACAQAIEAIAEETKCKRVLIGLGMPGLKTADKRGIAVVANGPRMVNYCNQLERRLDSAGIKLEAPIHHLGSDADYCGIGENYAADGLFSDVENGYYLGGGTGVADAMKLDGELVPFDLMKSWNPKTWELQGDNGLSLERFISAGGIQSLYAKLADRSVSELNSEQIFPPQIAEKAVAGDKSAQETYQLVARNLAALLHARIVTLYRGWNDAFPFMNSARAALEKTHDHLGKLFQRIIIGQRLGDLMTTTAGDRVLTQPVFNALEHHIAEDDALDDKAKKHYKDLTNIIFFSRLREAPALGAGVDAFFSWQDYQ